ncbi:L-2-amino-thiazoline-4-carboxylic acid hydrolase [Ilyonectria destructans]|nr:L-2-amino-thiazoline-4-carboxylic acid hydrolase [Ilyonectria destructans]
MIKAFQKEFGTQRARDVIRKGIDTYSTAYGKFIAAHNNGNSVQKMATAYSAFADGGKTIQYTVEKDTPQAYDPIVNRCRYAELFKKIGEPELGAIIFCEADYPMVRAIGPDLELFRTETMMMGAKRCDFRYRLKETAKDNRT